MLTRCPDCETTFRVTPEQLKARHGKVRCGECQAVFNALDTLVEDAPVVAPPAIEEVQAVPEAPPAVMAETEEAEPAAEPAPDVEPEAALAAEDSVPLEPEPEPAPAHTADLEPEPVADEHVAETPAAGDEWLATTAIEARRRWPWALGGAFVLLVLGLEALMHFRTEIAVLQPDMKPVLAGACEFFGCEMRLPRKAELMSIETSDLHPETDGKLLLTATLKNRAPFAQEHPHLELTLTDTADKALVRRVLAPVEYTATADRSTGLTPGKELPVELSIDAPGVPAAGYRLYLFYP